MEGTLSREPDLRPFGNYSENSTADNRGVPGNGTANPLLRNEEVAKVEVAVLASVLFLALTGNLCVLLAIHQAKPSQSRMYFFMKHLSIADLVVAVFQVLPQLIWDITFRFYGPDVLCRLVKYLQVVGMFASTYMLVLMSVDRCLAICQPLRSLHRRSDHVYVLLSWLLSLLVSVPQVYIFRLKEVGSGVHDCWGDFVQPWGMKAYVTWITLTIYVIPVTVLSACYGLISFKIWQNLKLKTRRGQSSPAEACRGSALSRVSSVKLISKAKIRTVKMTFVIVVAYVVCWTPFFFVQMWAAWDPAAPREASAFIIAMLLASLNSCCNPWIYMFFAGHLFRGVLRHFLCCSSRRHLKTSQCSCELRSGRKGTSSTLVMKSSGSQRSVTQTSVA
ncbi:oxytocin receptor [Erpetoichthys calabaricus]|uniref:Oxytocin receptor b n=1 Tax=Erpetoichthys calabaricus TaxID=27687 RepID=A0A8C4T0Y2_ERPCA|nr:oxytocin receptor [Erpetoichthys calabaricus]